MMIAPEYSIPFLLLLPLLAIFLPVVVRHPNIRDAGLLLLSASLLICTLRFAVVFSVNFAPFQFHLWSFTPELDLAFSVEPLGMIFALVVSMLWFVTMVYTIGYMRKNNYGNQGRFYAFFSLSIFAALAIAFSDNLLTLFIFYEVLTLATFPLVAHRGNGKSSHGYRHTPTNT